LSESSPDVINNFIQFLEIHASKHPYLFILGDLFEYWIGDDTNQFSSIIKSLKALSNKVSIYFIAGNRDFLIGQGFAKKTNIHILKDPTLIQLGNKITIILHGDTLCTDDKNYQKFRKMVRPDNWFKNFITKIFLALPQPIRFFIFKSIRAKSEKIKKGKDEKMMDANERAIKNLFQKFNYPSLMIHGHTHRPKVHKYSFKNNLCQRWVLNDWYDSGSFLLWKEGKLKTITI